MKKIIFYILSVILLVSCNDLQEEVFSSYTASNYLKTEDELKAQALGLYDFNPHSYLEDRLYELLIMPNRYFASKISSKGGFSAYNIAANNGGLNTLWNRTYGLINRANVIIKYAPNAPLDEETINQHVAEARFIRAYYNFMLVRLWGEVPLVSEPVESLSNEVLYVAKSPVSKIYQLIIEDLDYAKDNLPKTDWGTDSPQGRVKAGAAYNLLGLVHLTSAGIPLQDAAGYDKAIEVIEEMMSLKEELGVELLSNWADNFKNDKKVNSEKLYALGSIAIAGYGSVLPFRCSPPGSVGLAKTGAYQYAVSYDFYQMFEDEDVRKQDGFYYSFPLANGSTRTYVPDNDNAPARYGGRNGVAIAKYVDGTATSPIVHSNEVFYMRFVESYLILAEAYCESGNLVKARENLNIVRGRVNASVVGSDVQADLRQIVRDERWRELYGEFTEVYDMRRWGTVKENFDNHPLIDRWYSATAKWDDKYLLYPIPSTELTRNPKLVQNTGW